MDLSRFLDPNIQGPILDTIKKIAETIWWNGFYWGLLVGFVAGVLFQMLAYATMKNEN